MKHIFIINPAAGERDNTRKIIEIVKNAVIEKGIDYEIRVTERPKHATEIVRKALEATDETLRFYACGGDGTLNEVAQGVVGFDNAQITNLPYGTGNDFIRAFGEKTADFILENLIDGDTVDIDYIDTDNGMSINITTIGFDAHVAKGMQKYKRIFKKNGQIPYIISIFENIARPLARNYKIEIDGKDVSGKYVILLLANGNYYGGGFHPVPDASLTDGKLNVLLVKKLSRFTILGVINAYKNGEYKQYPQYIDYFEAKEIKVMKNGKYSMYLNLDGEVFEVDKAKIAVSQQKIHFVVPKKTVVHE